MNPRERLVAKLRERAKIEPPEYITGGPVPEDVTQAIRDYYQWLTCEICGHRMQERKCRIKCPRCGFERDCSDP